MVNAGCDIPASSELARRQQPAIANLGLRIVTVQPVRHTLFGSHVLAHVQEDLNKLVPNLWGYLAAVLFHAAPNA
jgi:hypothetical protein